MSAQTLFVDTSILPADVLSFYDDAFYRMVERIAGLGEAKLLEIQGIRSVYSFLNTEDVFQILSVQCAVLKEVKKFICLQADDQTYIIKPGCRSNIRYLYQLLHQKHQEHVKQITTKSRRNKQSQQTTGSDMNLSQDSVQHSPTSLVHQQDTTTSG